MNALKERLDVLLVQKGYFETREKAKRSIMAGIVFADGIRLDKAGMRVDTDAEIEVRGKICPYVSRGGLKLEKSITEFSLDLENKICMDVGASTGGFTDCMLQNGAKKVYSVDVGYGQLDWKLRNDSRVVNMEKCNVRYMDTSLIEDKIDFVSIDVSFISLSLIFPVVSKVMTDGGKLVSLIKPQFEAGRNQVGKNGIVRDADIHREVIEKVVDFAKRNGFTPIDLTFSPITGAKGNVEFLLYAGKNIGKTENVRYNFGSIEYVVKQSQLVL